ncbi:hypothetical protein [Terriglobus roseus]|uniref:hypothetical protein n=1 Tax=Terriglobus roseus TaxID=392734 RepID=UPI001BAFBD47|nr:hypothetical protein [Terriglobus roseus]
MLTFDRLSQRDTTAKHSSLVSRTVHKPRRPSWRSTSQEQSVHVSFAIPMMKV